MMMLIRVCDLETTGLEPPEAAPCEVAWCDLIILEGGEASIAHNSARETLCNPSRPIPPELSAIHHIIDEDVVGKPFWPAALAACAQRDGGMLRPTIFAAHNARFERQWFTDEVTGGAPWICTYKCALRVWPDAPSHSNQALRYWLKPEGLNREIAAVAHRDFPDAYVTALILRELLRHRTPEELVEITAEPALLPRVRFGEHRGAAWRDVPLDYLQWVVRQDMDEDTLFTARAEIARRPSGARS